MATDPDDDTLTNVVVLQLKGEAPKVYSEMLMVKASDFDSVHNFVKQLCTDKKFFPNLNDSLLDRRADDEFIKEQAQHLFDEA